MRNNSTDLIYKSPWFSGVFTFVLFTFFCIGLLIGAIFYSSLVWLGLFLFTVFYYISIKEIFIYYNYIITSRGFFFASKQRILFEDCLLFRMDNGTGTSRRYAIEYREKRGRKVISFHIPKDKDLVMIVKLFEEKGLKIQSEIYNIRAFTKN